MRSPWGKAGTWLLDPNNITISTAANSNESGDPSFTSTDDSSVVNTTSIQNDLNAGTNVSITTASAGANTQAGDITVSNTITKSAGGDATLTLSAYRNIIVNAAISSSSNKLNMLLNADNAGNGSGYINIGAALTTRGGNITLGGGSGAITAGTLNADGTVNTAATGFAYGNAGQDSGVRQSGGIDAGGGNIIINGIGYSDAAGSNYGVYQSGGSVTTTGSGTISISGTGGTGGGTNYGVYLNSSGATTASGNLTVIGQGGATTGGSDSGVNLSGHLVSTSGSILVNGTGGGTGAGNAGTNNAGIIIVTDVTSTSGPITLLGTGGTGTGGTHYGIQFGGFYDVTSTGSSPITLIGIGGSGGANDYGITMPSNNPVGGASATGNIIFNADTINAVSSDIIRTTGTVTIKPYTASTTVGFSGGAGTLQVTQAIMDAINAPTVVIGSANSGSLTTAAYTWDSPITSLTLYSGNNDTIGGAVTKSVGGDATLTVKAVNAISAIGAQNFISTSGKLNLIFDATNAGVTMSGPIIITNGGDVTIGGGATPLITATGAQVDLTNVTLNAGGGNISVMASDTSVGLYLHGGSISTTGSGTITLSGTATTGNTAVDFNGATVSSVNGDINVTGMAALSTGIVVADTSSVSTTGTGNITLTGHDGGGGYGIITPAALTLGGASDDGNITLVADTLSLAGTTIQSLKTVTIKPYTASTTIGLSGGAGTLAVTQAIMDAINAPTVTVGRTDGTGLLTTGAFTWESTLNNLNLETGGSGGNLTVGGAITQSSVASASLNLYAGGNIITTPGDDITASGGGHKLNMLFDSNYANGNSGYIDIGDNLTSNGGNITLGGGSGAISAGSGYAWGNAGQEDGIYMLNRTINAGGGNIILNGTGKAAGATTGDGIMLQSSTVQTSGSGTITLTGVGGSGTNFSDGLYLNTNTISAVNGNISIIGTGGTGGNNNYGVQLLNGSGPNIISTTGSGAVTLNGGVYGITSSYGANNLGGASQTADITLIGDALSVGAGLDVQTTATVTFKPYTASTTIGFSGGAGTLQVTQAIMDSINAPTVTIGRSDATGTLTTAAYTWDSPITSLTLYGNDVTIGGAISKSVGVDSALNVTAVNSTITQNAAITSTSGKLNTVFDATNGSIDLYNITSNGGNITVGGGVTPLTTAAGGFVRVSGGATVNASGGNITLNGSSSSTGVTISNSSLATSAGGNITISGTSSSNLGVTIVSGSSITAVNGNITITGSGTSAGQDGIYTANSDSIYTTGTGTITLSGVGSAGAYGIENGGTLTIGGASDNGNITLIADKISLASTTIQSLQSVTIKPYTASTTVGFSGGAGTLGVTSTILADITAANTIIGRSDGTGLMRVLGADLSADTFGNLSLLNGSANIQFDGSGTTLKFASGKNFSATTTTGDITAPTATGTIQTQGTGTITLTSGHDINETFALALTSSTGAVSLYANNDIIDIGAITSSGGAVLLNSDRDASGAGAINIGGNITSNGGNITLGGGSGAITAGSGYATGDAGQASGINITASLTAAGGNIILNGNGYTGGVNTGNAYGVLVQSGSQTTTGNGAITITGTGGGSGSGGFNTGVDIVTGTVSVVSGNLIITGTGGTGTGNRNSGVEIYNNDNPSATLQTSGSGTILLTGTGGGSGASVSDYGVLVGYQSTVQSTGVGGGGITVIGYSGDSGGSGTSAFNGGVMSNGTITSVDGNILIDGNTGTTTGQTVTTSTGSDNYGILLYNASTTSSTGNATITLNGMGGGSGAGGHSYGMYMAGGLITTVNSNIAITGTGANTSGGSDFGIGIDNSSCCGPTIKTTGTGNITLTGIGGNSNAGIATGGIATIGGAADNGNIKIVADTLLLANETFTTGASGSVTFTPYTTGTTVGVGSGAGTLSVTDAILGTVTAGFLTIGDAVKTTAIDINTAYTFPKAVTFVNDGAHNITLDSNVVSSVASGNGITFSDAVVLGANTIITTSGGNVTFSSTVDGAHNLTINSGTATFTGIVGGGTALSNLTITSDNLTFGGNVFGTGTLTIAPSTAGQAINLNNGATGLYLTTTEIGYIQNDWASIVIGSTSDTATMTVGAATWAAPLSLLNGSGDITINGAQSMGANTFYANTASGNLTLGNGASVTSTSAGNAIVVATGGNFVNNSGSSTPFTANNGRFIGYSHKKANDTNSVTNQQEITGFDYGSLPPGSIVPATYNATQNTWVYDVASGTITLTAIDQTVTYGTAPNSVATLGTTFTFSCSDGCLSSVLTGGPGFSFGGTTSGSGNYTAGSHTITLAGAADNNGYTINYLTGTLTVNPKALTVTADAQAATYGDTLGALTYATTGLVAGDSLSGALGVTNGIGGTALAGTVLKHQNNFDVAGSPFAIVQGTLADSDYTITYTGNNLTLAKKALTDATFTANAKTYDGTTAATISSDGALVGVVGTDTVTIDNSGASATFDNKNVGITHVVTATGYALAGAQAGDYTLTQPATGANVTISALGITVTADAESATYGDTLGALTYTSSGLATGDSFSGALGVTNGIGGTSLAGTVLKHQNNFDVAGSPFAIVQNGLTISDGNGGANYTITYTGNNLTLAKKALTDTTFTAANKTYDGTTAATITSDGALIGVVGTDTVTIDNSGASATFSNQHVGNGKTVTAAGYALAGAQAGDYSFTQPTALANITAAALTITASDQTKTYANDALGTAAFTSVGLQNGETIGNVTLSAVDINALGTSSSGNHNVGIWEILGSAAGGGIFTAGDYSITYATTGRLTINQKALTITGLSGTDRAYNGLTSDTVTGSGTLNTVVGGDAVTLNDGTASFADQHVGNGKVVTFAGYSISGTDAGNYSLSQPANSTANITAAALTVTAADQTHSYGFGGNAASLGTTGFTTSGLVNGETIGGVTLATSDTTSTSGNYKAGTYTLTPSAATGGSFTAGDYTITYANAPTGLTVNALTLTVTGMTASNKTYDGATTATVNNAGDALSGVLGGDAVTLNTSATASFSDQHVGIGKTVTGSGFTLTNTDAGNYVLTQPTALANITAAALTVTANAQGATYGDTLAALTYTTAGLIGGDSLSGSLTTAHGGAGTALTHTNGFDVSGGPFAITQGTLANSDYAITYNSANLTLGIKGLAVSADNKSMVVGSIEPALTYSITGLASGDATASFTGALARASGTTAGTYAIDEGTLLASGNYSIASFNQGTFTITGSLPPVAPSVTIPDSVLRVVTGELMDVAYKPVTMHAKLEIDPVLARRLDLDSTTLDW